ncbi:dipeptidase [Penaeicola halotolerans]|uniref:dipeptidase n=1 Tax=Penaeicola halotolerans TaxID=2793196 RepID=UPI001CF8EA6C|nr:membrane dipeptidase [Penaeicola halotolerans]
MKLPIVDTHCDLLSYLASVPSADAFNSSDIACSIPLMAAGNVKLQVMAIYNDVVAGSVAHAKKQADIFASLAKNEQALTAITSASDVIHLTSQKEIGMVAAIESAAGLCEENMPLEETFKTLDYIIQKTGRVAYISLTHHGENRFGGGNYTQIGLKDDGRKLLDHLTGKQIAVDLSHTSDLLAEGILEHLSKENLDIPIIASHSNFRALWNHPRNLPAEFVQEIIQRKGLIGINFLRAFLDNDVPERVFDHILYGFEHGAADCLCFGADYFYTKNHPDKSRIPFYFPVVEDASCYPDILDILAERGLSQRQLEALAYGNAQQFFERIWD